MTHLYINKNYCDEIITLFFEMLQKKTLNPLFTISSRLKNIKNELTINFLITLK